MILTFFIAFQLQSVHNKTHKFPRIPQVLDDAESSKTQRRKRKHAEITATAEEK